MINLRSGKISFLPTVLDKVAIGVFIGDGEFTLAPFLEVDKN